MSRIKRTLQKRFVVFCEGDTEYNYINAMRKNAGVQVILKPINMKGGGYLNFLKKIKTESSTDCLAKFVIVDGDRINNDAQEKKYFKQLLDYCKVQNQRRDVPIFLIVNNPDFEYVACLHFENCKNQQSDKFLTNELSYQSIDQFKGNQDIYKILNTDGRSYQLAQKRLVNAPKLVANLYIVKKKSFEIMMRQTIYDAEAESQKSSNMDEFFDVINW